MARVAKNVPKSEKTSIKSITDEFNEISCNVDTIIVDVKTKQMRMSDYIEEIHGTTTANLAFNMFEKDKLCEVMKAYSSINKETNYSERLHKCVIEFSGLIKSYKNELNARSRSRLIELGRTIAGASFLFGNVYTAVVILRTILDLNPNDSSLRTLLLRWTIRLAEWEAFESIVQDEKKRGESSDSAEDILKEGRSIMEMCEAIHEFHRSPKTRGETSAILKEDFETLCESKEKTFLLFESQVLLGSSLAHVSRVTDVKRSGVLDPLYCLEIASIKSETIVKSRLNNFGHDKVFNGFDDKIVNSSYDYLKTCASIAEYFDTSRLHINECMRCGLYREASTTLIILLTCSIRLAIPMWVVQSLSTVLYMKMENINEKEELCIVRDGIRCLFDREGNMDNASTSCLSVSQVAEQLSFLSPFSDVPSLHLPSSSCSCFICKESSFNPSFAFELYRINLLYTNYSLDSIRHLSDKFGGIRSIFAPYQLALMKAQGVKPRPPQWMCDMYALCVCSFLLSSNGYRLEQHDPIRIELINNTIKICSYSSQSCTPYRLLLRLLSRKHRSIPTYVWMIRKASFMSKIANVSIGSESRTPKRVPLTPNRINITPRTPRNRGLLKSGKKIKSPVNEKEEIDEKKDWNNYGHLLYYEWRIRICERMALNTSDPWEKGMLWSETLAISSRQARRIVDRSLTPFGFTSGKDFERMVSRIPNDMTICQMIISSKGDLILVKIHSNRTPIIIPLARESKWQFVMEGIAKALKKCDETADAGKTLNDAKKYWEGRRKAEEMMKRAMEDVESDMLGAFSPMFLPSLKLSRRGESIASSIIVNGNGGMDRSMAREIVSIATQTNNVQYQRLIECLGELEDWSGEQIMEAINLKKDVKKEELNSWIEKNEMPLVFFVLSTEISRVPWEFIDILFKKAHCSRLISIHQLFSLLHSNKVPHVANIMSTYYVLDPGNDLSNTKQRLTPIVEKYPSWKGVTGKGPGKENITSILTQNDFFIYLGHGNGLRYLSRTMIRKLDCKAVVLLMGCSSAYTANEGRGVDGRGAALDYSIARCPCVVGCLYIVTDGEIDKYFTTLVSHLIGKEKETKGGRTSKKRNPSYDLRLHLEAMATARTHVKLPYLTGAAVVSYGIPIETKM